MFFVLVFFRNLQPEIVKRNSEFSFSYSYTTEMMEYLICVSMNVYPDFEILLIKGGGGF